MTDFNKMDRREFLGITGMAGGATLLATAAGMSVGMVQVTEAAGSKSVTPFRFAILTDGHLWADPDHRYAGMLAKAVEDVNNLKPAPDFVLYCGDIAQNGTREQLELGKKILSNLKMPMKVIPGEHDFYLDMGAAWRDMFGAETWSFDHKGVHFIGLNSILVRDFWTAKGLTPAERMGVMEELESHIAGPWGVRQQQLDWLEKDTAKLAADTPVVIFTHSPLWDYYPRWNFQTEDAPQIRKILSKFNKVMSFHGHVHQLLFNKIGNMSSIGTLSTSWPWPYPDVKLPFPDVKLNRNNPGGDFLDGMGSQWIDLEKDFAGTTHYSEWADMLPPVVKRGLKS
jgi:3',5'-cyclic-AMP phosphodiesterase